MLTEPYNNLFVIRRIYEISMNKWMQQKKTLTRTHLLNNATFFLIIQKYSYNISKQFYSLLIVTYIRKLSLPVFKTMLNWDCMKRNMEFIYLWEQYKLSKENF